MTPPATAFDDEALARGDALFRRNWSFVKGVVKLDGLPAMDRPEIAFAGRSNVGKSSLINALTFNGKLARTSNTPGRTQELNYFSEPTASVYLVDMPGYGYAEAPKAKVQAWTRLIKAFLQGRTSLRRVFVLIDARHGVKPVDSEILDLLDETAVSYQAVLTKVDKPSAQALAAAAAQTEENLRKRPAAFPVLLRTSATSGQGMSELRASIAGCL